MVLASVLSHGMTPFDALIFQSSTRAISANVSRTRVCASATVARVRGSLVVVSTEPDLLYPGCLTVLHFPDPSYRLFLLCSARSIVLSFCAMTSATDNLTPIVHNTHSLPLVELSVEYQLEELHPKKVIFDVVLEVVG